VEEEEQKEQEGEKEEEALGKSQNTDIPLRGPPCQHL
jgi:hypothetical protein